MAQWLLFHSDGYANELKGEFGLAQTYYEKTFFVYEHTDLTELAVANLRQRSWVKSGIGDYYEAKLLLDKGVEIVSSLESKLEAARLTQCLGDIAIYRGSFAKAERLLKDALQQYTELANTTLSASTYHMLGRLSCLTGDHSTAHQYLQKSLTIKRESNSPVSDVLWSMGNLAVAEKNFLTALHYYETSGWIERPYYVYIGGLGWAKLGLGDLDEANQYFLASLNSMLKTKAKPHGLDALVGIAHLQALSGKFERALELLNLVQNDTGRDWEIKEKVRRLRDELVAELPPELVAEAEARGRELDLWETAEALLAEEA